MSTSDHNALVQREFTKQAQAYAGADSLMDPDRVMRLVRAVGATPDFRALEVACGPGHVALVMAAHVGEMTGVDLTEAPLIIAEARRKERGIANLRFERGDAAALPYPDKTFDIVVCRFAFHHFTEPPHVLAEMVRLCRPGGVIGVHDLIVSEFTERAAYQNGFENLRDPSHTRAYPLTALLALFTAAGLEITHVSTESLTPDVEDWLARAQTPEASAVEVRRLIERDEREDLSGCRPFRLDGRLHFSQQTAIIAARRLPGR